MHSWSSCRSSEGRGCDAAPITSFQDGKSWVAIVFFQSVKMTNCMDHARQKTDLCMTPSWCM